MTSVSTKWGMLDYVLDEDGNLVDLAFSEAETASEETPDWLVSLLEQGPCPDLDLSRVRVGGTAFQQEVWRALLTIPSGETRSYKEIAVQIGRPKAVRAVGQALNRNRLPILFPCHRVIGANGNLTGFEGGLDKKRELLSLEQTWKKGSV